MNSTFKNLSITFGSKPAPKSLGNRLRSGEGLKQSMVPSTAPFGQSLTY